MGKVLIIAEKPSVGRDIAKVMKCNQKGEGYLTGENYIVTWAIGHLVTLLEPEEYDVKYKSWKFETLPILPENMKLKPVRTTYKQFQVVKKLMNSKEVDALICATDSGREGELIFRYIYKLAGCKKPFQRLWISSMTDIAIKEGFEKLKPGEEYDSLYESARCRSEADWLVGMNASRAYTIRYHTLLSIGRVQTPTLAVLVKRQKEINAFVPQEYWEVQGVFDNYQGIWFDPKTKESKIFEQVKAYEIVERVKNQEGVVEDISKEEKKQSAPLLYDLTELQRDANRKYSFSAKKTLSIAQELYEKRKLITYPRTDSRYLSQDMISKIKPTLKKIQVEPYKSYIEYILGLDALPIGKRIVDDSKVTDHHAIIPTDTYPKLQALGEEEKKIYDLIVRRFIAVFYPLYIYEITKIVTEVAGERFLSKGNTILQWGWMELYKHEQKKDKEDQELPILQKGQNVAVTDAQILQKKTQPPKPYTEATLLSAMENAGRLIEDEELKEQMKDAGLGTPATRAAIIERLLQVEYVERKGKALYPTEKGMKLIDLVPEELKSPETTGKWEKGLSSIARRKMKPDRFMESIAKYVQYLIGQASTSNPSVVFPQEKRQKAKISRKTMGKCPACTEGDILEHSKGFYCSRWKLGCKFTIWKNSLEAYGQQITPQIVKELLKKNKIEKIEIILPQTKEKCIASLVLKEDKSGGVELKNLDRIENKE